MATVLIIDDDPINRDLIATILAYDRHQTLQACNVSEALDVLRAQRPDLVILDLWMPDMNGTAFVRYVREDPQIAATPIALYTASSVDAPMRDFMAICQIHHVIPKPASPLEVLRVVRLALGEYESQ